MFSLEHVFPLYSRQILTLTYIYIIMHITFNNVFEAPFETQAKFIVFFNSRKFVFLQSNEDAMDS